jgi:predicted dinucleotide-binding enzyme
VTFSIIGTGVIGTTPAPEQHRALPVAADCEETRRPGMRLVDESGLAAYDVGVPAGSWRMTPAHCSKPALKDLAPALAAAAGTRPRATATGR